MPVSLASRITAAAVNSTRFTSPNTASECFKAATLVLPHESKSTLPVQTWSVNHKATPLGLVTKANFTAPSVILAQQRFFSTGSMTKDSTQIPDFSAYRKAAANDFTNRTFTYFMVGVTGVLTAASAKTTVHDFLLNMSASADVLALAKVEVDLNAIPEGKNIVIKWRGKPVFIRHRTASEIQEASDIDVASLRDPQTDAERTKRPEWLVMMGICTHLGCVPIGEAGDFGGWYCPCHGSHYDISGRIRQGPAPTNLEIPEYDFNEDKLVIG